MTRPKFILTWQTERIDLLIHAAVTQWPQHGSQKQVVHLLYSNTVCSYNLQKTAITSVVTFHKNRYVVFFWLEFNLDLGLLCILTLLTHQDGPSRNVIISGEGFKVIKVALWFPEFVAATSYQKYSIGSQMLSRTQPH